jgi:PAS domain S-box-containing protein/putative nucleotidyltransferase with HDIG domain
MVPEPVSSKDLLRVLCLEDSPEDAQLMCELLRGEGLDVRADVVDTRDGFCQALADHAYDLILADYRLPGFSGEDALVIANQKVPGTPFIVVSGTIGEETAVELLKQGADDCVLKDRLGRLPFAVRRSLQTAREQSARRAADERARFLADIIEHADQPMGVGYPDGRLGFVNAAFCRLTGYDAEELRAMAWSEDLTPAEWRPAEQAALAELARSDRPQRYEKEYVRKDGSRVPIELFVHAVTDELGEPEYYYSFVTDLTGRKKAEESLRESEERYRLLAETSPDFIYIIERDARVRYANARAAAAFGRPLDGLAGTALDGLFQREDAARMKAAVDQVFETGRAMEAESWLTYPQGKAWIATWLVPIKGADGQVRAVFGVSRDVTQLKRAEQAAAERSHFLEQLLESIPVPVYYKDADLHYLGCNQAFAQSVDHPREEILGKTVYEVYGAELARHFDETDRRTLGCPGSPQQDEAELLAPDRSSRSVLSHKAVFSDVNGKPAGIVGVNLDVTEIRHAERELAAGALQLRLTLKAAVTALGNTTEMRDPYTAGHQRRVAELACAIAAELGWEAGRIETLRTAALLHDIGKIVVPAEILSKPGRLSEVEMSLIRMHATAGADTVADIDFEGAIADMIRQHHERLDGSGYPAGLHGREILPEACVLAVADVVEAMISHRPYRSALPIEEALSEIEGGGGVRYDADVVSACSRLFREGGFSLGE